MTDCHSKNDQNFHIFNWMLSGLTKQERLEEFQLAAEKIYKIIGDDSPIEDGLAFEKLIEGFKVIGFREADMNQIFKIIAAIIHLGELQFM